MTIAVVIPFFQRESGLLRAALESVGAQSVDGPIRVVVVDDASPLGAESELAGFAARPGITVDVLRQPNAGPAAARNRGLDALGDDVTHVAFLDSDDVWTEHHLAHALAALAAGNDFYFADHYQLGQDVSAFARAGRLVLDDHPAIDGDGALRRYTGDMLDQIIAGNVIGTSTVVYDFGRFRSQRFDEAFYSAGEDYLFWIACAQQGARFAFSTDVEVRYGFGVNIYAGSGWGTDGYMLRIQNEMRYRKKLLTLDLTPSQRRAQEDKIVVLRSDFANDVVHRLMHRKPLRMDVVRTQLRLDPRSVVSLPIVAGQIVANRIKGKDTSGTA